MRESPKEPTTSWWCIQRHCCFSLSLCKVNKAQNSKKNGEVEKQGTEQECGVCLILGRPFFFHYLFVLFMPFSQSLEFFLRKKTNCQLVGLSEQENGKDDSKNQMQPG